MKYISNILEKNHWSVEIDLNRDFTKIIKHKMLTMGFSPSNDKYCVYEYFNLLKRKVAQIPRVIEKSKEFACPEEYEVTLTEFEKKIVEGDDLLPYMSKKIKEINYSDGLLNDWNIQHFHLSRHLGDAEFVARSDYELFVYLTDNIAYLIQIYPHKKKNLYSTQEMVKIIWNNWPHLLEKNRLHGILSQKIDDEAYAKLRKANITTAVQVNDEEALCLIGGGYMSNGFSTEAIRNADSWFNLMKRRERGFVENIEGILHVIKQVNGLVKNDLDIHLLWFDNDKSDTMFDKMNQVIIQFDYQAYQIRVCKPEEVFSGVVGEPRLR